MLLQRSVRSNPALSGTGFGPLSHRIDQVEVAAEFVGVRSVGLRFWNRYSFLLLLVRHLLLLVRHLFLIASCLSDIQIAGALVESMRSFCKPLLKRPRGRFGSVDQLDLGGRQLNPFTLWRRPSFAETPCLKVICIFPFPGPYIFGLREKGLLLP